MEFGIFDHLDRNDLPLSDYYQSRLKIVESYDRLGFYAYHVAERFSLSCRPAHAAFAIGSAGLCAAALSSAAHDQGNLHAGCIDCMDACIQA